MRNIEKYLPAATAVALVLASPAFAQTRIPETGVKPSQIATATSGQIEEIVVTAQRREQRLQDVPVAVSAVTAKSLANAGITATASLQTTVPSLDIVRNGGNLAQPFIRGIGSSIGTANAEASVAIYLDGVYQPAAFGNFFNFNNIQRAEVLKGPQGTLFGRNSTGGVIQVITKDPSKTPEGEVSVGYANYNTVSADGYVSVPLNDKVGVNAAVTYSHQMSGCGKDLATGGSTPGDEELGTRFKLLFRPSDSTQIRLAADYEKSQTAGNDAQQATGAMTINHQAYPGNYNTRNNFVDFADTGSYGFSAHFDHDFGPVRLESISAYRHIDGDWAFDSDLSPLNLVSATVYQYGRMYSQELHLLSPVGSKLQWLVGAYYFNYDVGQYPQQLAGARFAGPPFGPPGSTSNTVQYFDSATIVSGSIFGQATYPLPYLPKTNLTLGIRETRDRITGGSFAEIDGARTALATTLFGADVHQSTSYLKPTWRAAIDHKFLPDLMGYVSYDRGVKSGNINMGGPPSASGPYQPEQITSYEAGFKSEFFDKRLRVNAEAFYYDFKNLQFALIVNAAAHIFNAPSATSYGGEIELEALPIRHLTVNLAGAYLHAVFNNFPNAPNTQRLPSGLDNGGVANYNAEGNTLPNSPKFTGNLGLAYEIPTNVGAVTLASNVYYFGGAPSQIDNRLKVNPYTLLNGSIGWTDSSDRYSIKLWAENLLNAYYYSELLEQGGGTDLGTAAPPRTFGIKITYRFR